jgi:hypothetical protein
MKRVAFFLAALGISTICPEANAAGALSFQAAGSCRRITAETATTNRRMKK